MNEDTLPVPTTTPGLRLEDISGTFPRVSATPTWTPREFRDSLALDSSGARIHYYDFANNSWRTVTTTGRFELKIIDDTTTLTTGDGKLIFMIPTFLNGLNLTVAHAFVTTVSSSDAPTIQIRNVTDSVDMLSTKITIDANETTSYTAATAPVIDTAHDDVATGDLIAIDVDAAGTGAKGLGVYLEFS